jgi:hypothetical protein
VPGRLTRRIHVGCLLQVSGETMVVHRLAHPSSFSFVPSSPDFGVLRENCFFSASLVSDVKLSPSQLGSATLNQPMRRPISQAYKILVMKRSALVPSQ